MFKIQTLNKIDSDGLKVFPSSHYEITNDSTAPDAILLRSFSMHEMELPSSLKAIARAGAGVNNIPIPRCTEAGVVVFNTPGANANAVKELVLAGMLLASRDVIGGVNWARQLQGEGDKVPALVEKGKGAFGGNEIAGKTIALIGLGDIGLLVANAVLPLGVKVVGYDPYLSVKNALKLDRQVQVLDSVEECYAVADFISLHVPLMDSTRGMINESTLAQMKEGVKILNFARGELVKNSDLFAALESGKVSSYVTDFPDESVLNVKGIIPIPHLGASTNESEINCAVMASNQIREYLENGNIRNSVNFPAAEMKRNGHARITVTGKSGIDTIPGLTVQLSKAGVQVTGFITKTRNDISYSILDLNVDSVSAELCAELSKQEGVTGVNCFNV